jgi:phenylacetate-CoA ligase
MLHFDRYETRSPRSREAAQFRDLRGILAGAKARAPALRAQIKGIDLAKLQKYGDLARVPVVRQPDMVRAQRESPPLGGFVAARANTLRRLLIDDELTFIAESGSKDFWCAARALYAAGLRRGDILLNGFTYDWGADAYVIDAGAAALGCTVIPAGTNDIERQADTVERLEPAAYCGKVETMRAVVGLLAERGRPPTLKRGIALGTTSHPEARLHLAQYGVALRQIYATPLLGVIAYETEAPDGSIAAGLMINEGVIVEIVRPGTGIQVSVGEVGEVLVTRLRLECPMLRCSTGHLSAFLPEPSPCGRTNFRISHRLGDAVQATSVMGRMLRPTEVAEVARRHPELDRLRLIVTRRGGSDHVALVAEGKSEGSAHLAQISATLFAVLGLRAEAHVVGAGTLPNDGKVIVDDREVG